MKISVVWILLACGVVTHIIVLGLDALIVAPKMQLLHAMNSTYQHGDSSKIRQLYNSIILFGYVFLILESLALLFTISGILAWILWLIGGRSEHEKVSDKLSKIPIDDSRSAPHRPPESPPPAKPGSAP